MFPNRGASGLVQDNSFCAPLAGAGAIPRVESYLFELTLFSYPYVAAGPQLPYDSLLVSSTPTCAGATALQ